MLDKRNQIIVETQPREQTGNVGLALQAALSEAKPKCEYCGEPALVKPEDHYLEADGIQWATALCGTCIDVEYCCNVSKDLWGTKSLAYYIAVQEGMSDAAERLRGDRTDR